ncbi:transglycosylase domain-containing protein [Pseudalkalibacillus sp. Hm43]|uniref:transglycosylase domain-containing protein n=1 Tax=Pseudalkalibacillus sp. Hm43 TaxID=3450742 RepID=UPI003F420B41
MRLFAGYIITASLLMVMYAFSDDVWADLQQVESPTDMIENQVPIETIDLTESSTVHAQDGTKIATLHGTEHRNYIPFEQLPISVIHAFVAAEDNHFFEHTGIDGSAIIRAMIVNARSQTPQQGGSTITQQLARNLFLSHAKTYKRKLNEAFFSYQLENQLSKEEIFELYSNAIYFGNGVYGIETASQYYFGKTVRELSLGEIALLCGIPNSPNHYDPTRHLEPAMSRQHYVLQKMKENQFITEEEWQQAKKEKITLQVTKSEYLYPDYTSYVLHELKQLIRHSEGFEEKWQQANLDEEKEKIDRELDQFVYDLVYKQGVKIETHLNTTLQKEAQKGLKTLPAQVEGAFVILDHQTRQVAAMVGGKNMKANEFNRAYQAYRQPGSTIKPLLAFAPFLDVTSTPLNVPINASPICKGDYCPQNYGNAVYGKVSIREAIGKSINTAAVRLTDRIGVKKAFNYLEPFDFQEVYETDQKLSSVLGGFTKGVSPLEMTNAYTTFSNGGNYQPSRAIKRVLKPNGELLYTWGDKPKEVWSKNTNDKMRTLLNHVMTSGTGRQASIPAPYIGGKTGTTNNTKDLWFIGMTDRYTAGIWVGKDKPAPIPYVQSQAQHMKVWKQIMRTTLRQKG